MSKFVFSIAALLSVSTVFWACQSDEEAVKKAENDVFALHDEVMPKTDDVMKLRKQLNKRIASLDSVQASAAGTIRSDEEKEQARLLVRNLSNADSLMMNWMSRYNGDTLAKLSTEDALRYLSEQKDKITDVKTKLNSSIDQARQFLGTK
ncbi:viral A-type inclusion protein [Spirosoma utsteinense]|uniref:HEPN domain-containing protein n=1 Tax=Spirosoma utsteinense TaxID=2585773 RepID=A0ABR6VZR2_9BACT|nr:viral A-type inclusion protein [Spirosoma utsteinense]MBC3789750.1 HEPN domain-containing protein [Spirosoma utsteinense]